MRYSYFENSYKEKNYPHIPVMINADYKYINRAYRLQEKGLVGIEDASEKRNTLTLWCLSKDLESVNDIIPFKDDILGKDGSEYLDWLHDGLCDTFGDSEVEKTSRFDFINDKRDKRKHSIIHYILDNIDEYYTYFIDCDSEYEWIYNMYSNVKDMK